jgi:hypothetical protein
MTPTELIGGATGSALLGLGGAAVIAWALHRRHPERVLFFFGLWCGGGHRGGSRPRQARSVHAAQFANRARRNGRRAGERLDVPRPPQPDDEEPRHRGLRHLRPAARDQRERGPAHRADERLELREGDRILVYTDGIPEAQRVDGEFLDTDRLRQWISTTRANTAAECAESLLAMLQ